MNNHSLIYDNEFDWMGKNDIYKSEKPNLAPNPVTTINPIPNNTQQNNNGNIDNKKTVVENEKVIGEGGLINQSNAILQTHANNEANKPNKFHVNQTNYKFIETINNNERNNTVKANLNTLVQVTNNDQKNIKMNTSFNQSM